MSAFNSLLGGGAFGGPRNYLDDYSEQRKRTAWSATAEVSGRPDLRRDCDGRLIRWSEYGQLTELGWEIDHTPPLALGGGYIRARHWRGNRSAGGHLGNALRNMLR
ncbi:MAG: hypothetical protein MI861_20570 [Pirellulales bacterium]|nr:hypothetical protein [Pirellulales bacterium]